VNRPGAGKTILHVIDTTGPGGAETVFIELADRLRARGFRSVVLIRGPGWVCDQLLRRGITPYVFDAKGSFNWRFVRKLLRIIRKERVDLIQSHLLGSNVYCAIAGILARKPVVATFHGMVDVGPNERFRKAKLGLMNYGVNRFVAVSKNLRDAIDRQGLLNPDKCGIIYNGIDLSRYRCLVSSELRERLNVDREAILIGSLGNVRPAKGYDLLIRAARQVVDGYPNAHFVIAGDPKSSLQRQLDELVKELNLTEHFHFIGFCDDSPLYLAQLDYFVLSSTSEGLSIATIEALAAGLPSVITRCGGPEEIVIPNVDALMVEPEADSIATALLQLLGDKNLSDRLAREGRQNIAKKFDINAMLAGYERIYASVSN